jgi:hypothetical protein
MRVPIREAAYSAVLRVDALATKSLVPKMTMYAELLLPALVKSSEDSKVPKNKSADSLNGARAFFIFQSMRLYF